MRNSNRNTRRFEYYHITLRRVGGALAILLAVAMLGGYAYMRTRAYAMGPIVEIHTPADGADVEHPVITVSGIARNIAHLSLNDRQIFTDSTGAFNESLPLVAGYSILEVTGRDKFDRSTTQMRRILYSP